jgi:hypothetical protein
MKKLLIMFCAVAFFGLTQTFAQDSKPKEQAEKPANVSEVEVAVADLPEAVQTALTGEEYQGWTVSKAIHVKKDDAKFYKIILTNGTEERKVKMDANGKLFKYPKEKEKEKENG